MAAVIGIPVVAFLFDVLGIRTSIGCQFFQCNDPLGGFLDLRPATQVKPEAGRARLI